MQQKRKNSKHPCKLTDDSIYFRYAELCDELAAYYAFYNHTDPIKERKQLTYRKKHFYEALEQLVHAHNEVK